MHKKKHNIIEWKLIRNFFHFRFNVWTSVSSILVLIFIYIYYLNLPDLIIFPNRNDFNYEFYTDSANGGNSIITYKNVSDSAIDLHFDLNEGFLSPYVGVSIVPKNSNIIDISNYNQIHIDIKGQLINNIGISFYIPNQFIKEASNNPELCFHTNLEILQGQNHYFKNLEKFKIPDWWRDLFFIAGSEKIKPDLKLVNRLNIGSAYTPTLESVYSIQIKAISFERNNTQLTILLLTMESIVMLLLIIIHYWKWKRKNSLAPAITIEYKAVDIETQQLSGFLNYINSSFHECDLTLEQVSKQTGINQRRIANYIQQTFGCNFKTYVNQIRINESKRLLKDSKLNMGEIAFKVGFGTQSHFNRVFKSLEGINPSVFRGDNK